MLISLGWGVVAWIIFFLALFVIFTATLLGAILFGILTLGGLSSTVIWLGMLSLVALIGGFFVLTSFVAKVVFGAALDRWILTRSGSSLVGNR